MSLNKLVKFSQIISQYVGIVIPPGDWNNLDQMLLKRVIALQLDSAQDYFLFLESSSSASIQEWALLISKLRVGESYFFRDSGQMTVLETVILPELLRLNAGTRKLRLLSAGCSTGEEAYSLAMLLDRIMPSWEGWDIKIIGVEIDAESLNTARRGLYTDWSFRRVPQILKNNYFKQLGSTWQIEQRIRNKVEFICANMVQVDFPNSYPQIYAMDLILCRNVF
ncbi:hypothetical protein TI04_11340, partial [Achromatium sp. WMS2]